VTDGQVQVVARRNAGMNLLVETATSVLEMPGKFAEVALHDPLSAVLIACGAAVVGASVTVFGYLTVGALLNAVTGGPDAEPRQPSR